MHTDEEMNLETRSGEFENAHPQPATFRELCCLILIVIGADLTIYRGEGFAGCAAFLAGAPVLFLVGAARRRIHRSLWLIALLLAGVVSRLVWCGSAGAVIAGAFLFVCFAMGLTGRSPWVLHVVVFWSRMFGAGHQALYEYSRLLSRWSPKVPRGNVFSILLPAVMLLVFGSVFVLANPDLLSQISTRLVELAEMLQNWLRHNAPGPVEVLFWLLVVWVSSGILRPAPGEDDAHPDDAQPDDVIFVDESSPAPLYPAFRNTLISVVGLFIAYLMFEFQTLWLREFPKGFHFSGYAHEGAAWLTVALALATGLLSLIFRGRVLCDPRVRRLKQLAWLWSGLNLLLAVAVIHRMLIYVEFNGMTRMRVVGFLGISSVVVGFIFVVWKIVSQHSFRWLIRRHLWTVTFAAYLYVLLPVDALVNQCNVQRILEGDPAPCVQISVHKTSAEGWLQLFPLLECDDVVIRDGVSAMLAEQLRPGTQDEQSWSAWQWADEELKLRLRQHKSDWPDTADAESARAKAQKTFHEYAWQWF